jgi:hypothetical protein
VRPHDHDHDDVLARAVNLLVARGAYGAAARMYPEDLIELRQGARVMERSKLAGLPVVLLRSFGQRTPFAGNFLEQLPNFRVPGFLGKLVSLRGALAILCGFFHWGAFHGNRPPAGMMSKLNWV